MGQQIGVTQAVLSLMAAPDVNNIRRLGAWQDRYADDLTGYSGGVVGSDRGDAVHSFNGPVTLARRALPEGAVYRGSSAPAGVYRPQGEFQNAVSSDPSLDPFHRNLWNRMAAQ